MKCNKCGKEAGERDFFCLYCGNNLENNNKNIKKDIQTKKTENINDDERDNTLLVAGAVFLLLIPFIIYGIIMIKQSLSQARNPSIEFFGPIPELIGASVYIIIVLGMILTPLFIIILGAFTGLFRTKEKKSSKKNK